MPDSRFATLVARMLRQPLDAARGYDRAKLRGDLVAGATVAVLAVPQAMAYAVIAGVPPHYGLYTLIVQSLIGSLWNSNPFLSVGPVNTQTLLVGAVLTRAVADVTHTEPGSVDAGALAVRLAVGLALLKGLLQVGFAALGLGALVRYVSGAVIVGFTAGAGMLIVAGQLPAFLGLSRVPHAELWPGLAGVSQSVLPRLGELRPASVAIGLASLALLLALRRVSPRIPAPLLAVLLGAGLVLALGLGSLELPLVSPFPASLPSFELPHASLAEAQALLGGALALALLGLFEAYSIGRTLALRSGTQVSADQELLSQGLTNALSSLFQSFPGSGSFSRSALNYSAGARTLYAGVWNSLFVALILLTCAPAAGFVPLASLAAVLFVIGYELVDWREIVRLRRASPVDFQVCLSTLGATLFLPLTYAVFIGVALNLALYLRRVSRLRVAEMVEGEGGSFQEQPLRDGAGRRSVVLLHLEGDLFFAVADELDEQLARLASQPVRVVILRLKRTPSIDATVLGVLDRFARVMRESGRFVLLCGLRPEITAQLRAFGLLQLIGDENAFEARPGVFASARLALERARELIGAPLDLTTLRDRELSDDPPAYQI